MNTGQRGATLREVLERGQLRKDDSEILQNFFAVYFGGKKKNEENKKQGISILDETIDHIINDEEMFIAGIAEGMISYPNDKLKLTLRLEKLFAKLKRDFALSADIRQLDRFKYGDKTERLLKMLKHLHTKEQTRAEIANHFGISEKTLSDDLKTLLDGFQFMGSSMKIMELERKTNTYRSIIHPIFLALNSAEIYAMTVGLKLLSRGTHFNLFLNALPMKFTASFHPLPKR